MDNNKSHFCVVNRFVKNQQQTKHTAQNFFIFDLESLSNELDREIEHEKQEIPTTTTKHVTIVEPSIRPSASTDDFNQTAKTTSGKNILLYTFYDLSLQLQYCNK